MVGCKDGLSAPVKDAVKQALVQAGVRPWRDHQDLSHGRCNDAIPSWSYARLVAGWIRDYAGLFRSAKSTHTQLREREDQVDAVREFAGLRD